MRTANAIAIANFFMTNLVFSDVDANPSDLKWGRQRPSTIGAIENSLFGRTA
jgi:hypothetical protein